MILSEMYLNTLLEAVMQAVLNKGLNFAVAPSKTADPPRWTNLSREERRALGALKQDNSIVVLKADKGNVTVILDASHDYQKILAILEDRSFKK